MTPEIEIITCLCIPVDSLMPVQTLREWKEIKTMSVIDRIAAVAAAKEHVRFEFHKLQTNDWGKDVDSLNQCINDAAKKYGVTKEYIEIELMLSMVRN